MKLQVKCRGKTIPFESPYTDNEAHARLKEMLEARQLTGDFPQDLYKKFPALSELQMAWVHYLVYEQEKKDEPKPKFPKIPAMLHYAQRERSLKWPVVRTNFHGREFKFTMAGPRAKVPGSINVIEPGEPDTWHGRIMKDGELHARRVDEEVLAALEEFNDDPLEAAKVYGKRTGRCCYCGLKLDREDSIVVGYGPVCAENYGRPHPQNGTMDLEVYEEMRLADKEVLR